MRRLPLRCTFVHAPNPDSGNVQYLGMRFMPAWVYTLAAWVPDDGRYRLAMADTRLQPADEILEADVYLFSGWNQDLAHMDQVRSQLAATYPDATCVVGGPIAWSLDQAGEIDRLGAFDHIHIGDGEVGVGPLLERLGRRAPLPHVVRAAKRFDIASARPLHSGLLAQTIGDYYGGIVEVSRGCPFLCEFCDIRVSKDNNRPHNKRVELILQELELLCGHGKQQIMLVCDNFIGDPAWAEEVVDRIIAWKQRTGFEPSIFTWLTINLHRNRRLLRKMRLAGFDTLFIGIESFSRNSLLETAKVQNAAVQLEDAVANVQAHGFIVVAGLIFGFDSDADDCFDRTTAGLESSGLLSGDPSFLVALPGTPLYRRMALAGRLRDKTSHNHHRYSSNIRFLLSGSDLTDGYLRFVAADVDGAHRYARLERFLANLESGHYVPLSGQGFGNVGSIIEALRANPAAARQLLRRLESFAADPTRLAWAGRGALAVLKRRGLKGRLRYLQFWLFAWSNAVLAYHNLTKHDLDLQGMGSFVAEDVLPAGYEETANEDIPRARIEAQLRNTTRALRRLLERTEDAKAAKAEALTRARPGSRRTT
ncbi:MAG: hypothetical protein ACI9WU_005334 [Myxococcota bacterium]|jgi:hypothetical protein